MNRRGGELLKTRVIGASKGKKTLSIESQKTGSENRLTFEDDAKTFAESSGMIIRVKPKTIEFGTNRNDYRNIQPETPEQERLPQLSAANLKISGENVVVPPRGGYALSIPETVLGTPGTHIQFAIKKQDATDITVALNKQESRPVFPDSGTATFKDITIRNAPIDASLPPEPEKKIKPLDPISTSDVLFVKMKDGSEKHISTPGLLSGEETKIDISLDDYKNIDSLVIKNRNTGISLSVTSVSALNPSENRGFVPQHAISSADDAIIKYEGITIRRPTNTIDDVVPEVTLNVFDKTEKTATIAVKPDVESAKEALITFVGKYNQSLAEINILSQNKPEIVEELDYLSSDEKKEKQEKLGMFSTDSSLTSLKSAMQTAASANYKFDEDAKITMLSQIGIATNATNYSGYTPSKLRGYLEIDEKKLDSELEKHLDDVRNMFGYDSDGDLIIDSGIGYKLDKQLTAYVQSGGVFAMKTSSLDARIKSSEQKIARLETQMDDKEAELRTKYGQMEGALNSLESQQNTIKNFSNSGNNNR